MSPTYLLCAYCGKSAYKISDFFCFVQVFMAPISKKYAGTLFADRHMCVQSVLSVFNQVCAGHFGGLFKTHDVQD